MTSFPVDSQRTAGDSGAGRRGATLNAAATGSAATSRDHRDLARLNHWPGAAH